MTVRNWRDPVWLAQALFTVKKKEEELLVSYNPQLFPELVIPRAALLGQFKHLPVLSTQDIILAWSCQSHRIDGSASASFSLVDHDEIGVCCLFV
jgi:hypothetical protein